MTQNQSMETRRNYATQTPNSFIVHAKSQVVSDDLAEDVEKRFDTSNYEVESPLPIGKNKKVIRLIKNKFGERVCSDETKDVQISDR